MFDYDKTPLVPPGTRVIVHEAPGVRKNRTRMEWMCGTLVESQITTNAIGVISQKQDQKE